MLVNGINIPQSDNQFSPMDFNSGLNDQEKIVNSQIKIDKVYPMVKTLSSVPTYTPANFNDQFCIYNGVVYCYISGAWVALNAPTQYKVGYGTGPASPGTQAITGIGFTPKMVIIYANISTNDPDNYTIASHSYGHASSTSDEYCLTYFFRGGAINLPFETKSAHIVNLVGTDGSADCVADLNSLDSDGFTINWTTATIACDFMYEVYG